MAFVASSSSNPTSPPSNYGQFVTVKLTSENYSDGRHKSCRIYGARDSSATSPVPQSVHCRHCRPQRRMPRLSQIRRMRSGLSRIKRSSVLSSRRYLQRYSVNAYSSKHRRRCRISLMTSMLLSPGPAPDAHAAGHSEETRSLRQRLLKLG
jgi:hypothetical protein